jgi:hypothetical protein
MSVKRALACRWAVLFTYMYEVFFIYRLDTTLVDFSTAQRQARARFTLMLGYEF